MSLDPLPRPSLRQIAGCSPVRAATSVGRTDEAQAGVVAVVEVVVLVLAECWLLNFECRRDGDAGTCCA